MILILSNAVLTKQQEIKATLALKHSKHLAVFAKELKGHASRPQITVHVQLRFQYGEKGLNVTISTTSQVHWFPPE